MVKRILVGLTAVAMLATPGAARSIPLPAPGVPSIEPAAAQANTVVPISEMGKRYGDAYKNDPPPAGLTPEQRLTGSWRSATRLARPR